MYDGTADRMNYFTRSSRNSQRLLDPSLILIFKLNTDIHYIILYTKIYIFLL